MLKSDEAIMLDGMKLADIARAFGQPVHAVNLQEFETLLTKSQVAARSNRSERASAA
jgi:hypothetical protein